MSQWKEFKLGELVAINERSIGRNFEFSAIEYIDTSSVTENKFDVPLYTTISDAPSRAKRLIANGDTIISTVRPNQKHFGFIKEAKTNQVVSTGFAVVTPKSIEPRFLYYFLTQAEIIEYLNTIAEAGTTTFPAFRSDELKELRINLPSLPTQRRIAAILSSLDDKIELNNAINKNLEELAQTLFKRWFVDFEFPMPADYAASIGKPELAGQPYKSSGGEMVESSLGMIPKGWEVYSMSDLLEPVSKTYPLKSAKEVVFLNTGDIQDGKFLHSNYSDPKTLPGQAKKSIRMNDILYSEIRPENKRFAFVHFDASKYVVSTKLMVLKSKVEIDSLFQYFILTQNEQIQYLQSMAESRSGTFPQITFSEVSTIKIALPNFDIVNTFVYNVLKPFFSSKFNTEYENQELANLRDLLLPKIISGQISVN